MCAGVCICVCHGVYVSVCVSVCVYVFMYGCTQICMCVHVYVKLCIYLPKIAIFVRDSSKGKTTVGMSVFARVRELALHNIVHTHENT